MKFPLKKAKKLFWNIIRAKKKENIIPVDYKGIANDVETGEIILVDDGKIQLRVKEIKNNQVITNVVVPNILKSRKGINIPGSTASLNAVTERDIDFIKLAVDEDVDFLALSFVREKNDILTAKEYVKKFNGDIPIVAKLEKPQSIENLDEIVEVSDAVMVARGDLGIELSPVEVPVCQKKLLKPVINIKKRLL